jgi:hypothetical protein
MAKVLIGTDYGSYAFSAGNQRIDIVLPNNQALKLERILLVTNVTSNVIIYNFANPSLGGYTDTNKLFVTYDTTSMNDTDRLQIWYYAEDALQVTDALNNEQDTASRLLLGQIAGNQPIPDNLGRQRVILEGTNNINSVSTVSTVSSVTTVSTVTALTNINTFSAIMVVPSIMQTPIELQMQKIVIT